jgi:hypothetical protein
MEQKDEPVGVIGYVWLATIAICFVILVFVGLALANILTSIAITSTINGIKILFAVMALVLYALFLRIVVLAIVAAIGVILHNLKDKSLFDGYQLFFAKRRHLKQVNALLRAIKGPETDTE